MKHARLVVQSKIDRVNANCTITIIDEDNGEKICEIPILYGDFVDLTTKEQHAIGANAKFVEWYKIGKKRVVSTMKFELPAHDYQQRDAITADVARMNCPRGWSIVAKNDGRSQFVYEYVYPIVFATTSICRYATQAELEKEDRDAYENSEKETAEKDRDHQEVVLV